MVRTPLVAGPPTTGAMSPAPVTVNPLPVATAWPLVVWL